MSILEIFEGVDDFLIDRVFQPLIDRFSFNVSPWQIGMNCQLGALIFQALSIALPCVLFGLSLFDETENLLAWFIGLVLFLGFMDMKPVLRPGGLNPLRPQLFSLRIVALLFLLYDLYLLFTPALFVRLSTIGDVAFVIGLYFMSCRIAPPKARYGDRPVWNME